MQEPPPQMHILAIFMETLLNNASLWFFYAALATACELLWCHPEYVDLTYFKEHL